MDKFEVLAYIKVLMDDYVWILSSYELKEYKSWIHYFYMKFYLKFDKNSSISRCINNVKLKIVNYTFLKEVMPFGEAW